MQRGVWNMVFAVLAEVKEKNRAKSRIASRCSVSMKLMQQIIDAGFLIQGSWGEPVRLTPKGSEFLSHCEALEQLWPTRES
jgi:predicted transcriptional regulator